MPRFKCFISAAYGDDMQALQRVLDELEVDWQWANSTPSDRLVIDAVVNAIKNSSFVIGVVREDRRRQNVMVEMGIAIGLGRPVLLLSLDEIPVPGDLREVQLLRTDLDDKRLLKFQIDLFLRGLTARSSVKRTKTKFSEKKLSIEKVPPSRYESAVEAEVVAAIDQAGGRATIPTRVTKGRTPDLLMWMPHVDSELFNPAVIEIRGAAFNDRLDEIQLDLAKFIQNSGVRCALIITAAQLPIEILGRLRPIPNIFVLTLEEFKQRLHSGQLAVWVKYERNRLAHGVR